MASSIGARPRRHLPRRPTRRRAGAFLLALAATAGSAACGRSRPEAAPRTRVAPVPPVAIVVANSLTPTSRVAVFLVPRSGARRRLGEVAPGESATLTFQGATVGQEFRLVARTLATNRAIQSRPFSLAGVGLVSWDLFSNTLETAGRDP